MTRFCRQKTPRELFALPWNLQYFGELLLAERTVFVDTIGLNQERDVTDPTYLADFYKLDRAILLYETSPKNCKLAF